jgi:quercetin dioxygenase-like cupin family protein
MLTPGVYLIAVSADALPSAGWLERPILSDATDGLRRIACSVVTVAPGRSRHPAHSHDAEQIVIVVDGALQVAGQTLQRGAFVFIPQNMPHSQTTVGDRPVTFLAIAWSDGETDTSSTLTFSRFDAAAEGPLGEKVHPWGVRQRQCDAATGQLAALRSHVSLMTPGSGYAPHADPYDVVIVTLDGTVETLERTVPPDHVILYPAGSMHGMHNPGPEPARYVVFELHSRRNSDHLPRPPLLARLSDPRRWRRSLGRMMSWGPASNGR